MRGYVEALEAFRQQGITALTEAEIRGLGFRRVQDEVMVDLEIEMEEEA